MLKKRDIVYRINLDTNTVDKLKVESIVDYGDSFEFDLRSEDPKCKSNGCYKYYECTQKDAELALEKRLIFDAPSKVTSFIFKKEMELRKELQTYQFIRSSAMDLY